MRNETRSLLTGAYAVYARDAALATRFAEKARLELQSEAVELAPIPHTDLFCVVFAVGKPSRWDKVEVEWRQESMDVRAKALPLDEHLGAEGIVVCTPRSTSPEWRVQVSRALLTWAAERYQDVEVIEEVEATAIHLSSQAKDLLMLARRCSQLADQDDRSWTLARILRRHASELHSLLPALEEEARLLRASQERVESETEVDSEQDELLMSWPGSEPVIERILPALHAFGATEVLAQALLLLDTSGKCLDETERLLAVLCEEDQRRSDHALNIVVYWLGVITLGLGVVTLWDKYQTDQVYGLPLQTAVSVVAGLAIPLVVLFLIAAIRHGVLFSGLRRWLRRVFEPVSRDASWLRQGFQALLHSVWPLRPSEPWFRWVDRERLILAHSVLAARQIVLEDDDHSKKLNDLDEEAEGILGVVWDSILATVTSSEVRRQKKIRLGASRAFDVLWEEALRNVTLNGLWFSLPRPIPRQLWAALLLLGRESGLSWSQPWCWCDVEGGDDHEIRAQVRAIVVDIVSRKWLKAHGEPCSLNEDDCWGLISGREFDGADIPSAPSEGDWDALLGDALPDSESMQDLLLELRSLRCGIPIDEKSEVDLND